MQTTDDCAALSETPLMPLILQWWYEVLGNGCPVLHADSSFFLAGGDSLQMAQLLVRIKQHLGLTLHLQNAASFSTPGKMARVCAELAPAGFACKADLEKADIENLAGTALLDEVRQQQQRYPASVNQQSVWLAEQMSEGCGLYNTAVALQLSGSLNIEMLEQALGSVLRQHEVLRSRFRFDVLQRVLEVSTGPCPDKVLAVGTLVNGQASTDLQLLAANRFDLAQGPLWRFQLFTTGSKQHVLLLCLHHLVTDGWSGTLLLRKLAAAYNALLQGDIPQALPTDSCFRDCCVVEYQQKQSAQNLQLDALQDKDGLQEKHGLRHTQESPPLNWWRQHLQGADTCTEFAWLQGAAEKLHWPYRIATVTSSLPTRFLRRITLKSQAAGVTVFALLLTALRLALLAVTGNRELCIGIPVAGRTSLQQESSVGYYANMLVSRATVAADVSAGIAAGATATVGKQQVLQRVHAGMLEELDHHAVAYPDLLHALKPVMLPSGNAWFDIVFAFQNLPGGQLRFSGLEHRITPVQMPWSQFPLKLEIMEVDSHWRCSIHYARELLTRDFAQQLTAGFYAELEGLLQA